MSVHTHGPVFLFDVLLTEKNNDIANSFTHKTQNMLIVY